MKKFIIGILIIVGLFGIVEKIDAVVFITPTEITPGTAGSWIDVNLNAYVPSGATGVILEVFNKSGDYSYDFGWRKDGSSDNRIAPVIGYSPYSDSYKTHIWVGVGVGDYYGEGNRIIELYVENITDVDAYLLGYYTNDTVFFTNAVDKSLGTPNVYTDIDISSDTGGNTAIGAIFEIYSPGMCVGFSLRNNGSSDNRQGSGAEHEGGSFWVGVDGSEICEGTVTNVNLDFFLTGYIISNHTFLVNATDYSAGALLDWTDLSALPSGAIGAYMEITSRGSDVGLRKNGSSYDNYAECTTTNIGKAGGVSEADASRIVEAKTYDDEYIWFWLQGYPTEAAPPAERRIIITQ